MSEAGVNISEHRSKHIDELKDIDFAYVVTVCGHTNESCPFFPDRTKVVHVGFDDPPKMTADRITEEEILNCYGTVRDQIKDFVNSLPEALEK
jgi:arsenate reductase